MKYLLVCIIFISTITYAGHFQLIPPPSACIPQETSANDISRENIWTNKGLTGVTVKSFSAEDLGGIDLTCPA